MAVRKAVDVAGIVQGVGFRPYVYRLATEQGLAGSVGNNAYGVSIEVQGAEASVADFLARLAAEAPPLAQITAVNAREVPCNGDLGFRIVDTDRSQPARTLISPDIAVCDDCLRELFDPADRRYRYPFINCTNCGPRFTIIRDIPYDRPYTSMARFQMCPACNAEYEDPMDRRFHAQPNACWECGPRLELRDAAGQPLGGADVIEDAVKHLRLGAVVAIKGLGGFHLACDATDARAVQTLRERKRRLEKPFAVMLPTADAAEDICDLDEAARQVLLSPQRPIVLLAWHKPSVVAEEVAPRHRYLGAFLPYTPLHHLILSEGGFAALVMTSANLSEEPICINNDEAIERLQGIADFFLVHDRGILLRCDDSVVRVEGGQVCQVRRSRGYVPTPIGIPTPGSTGDKLDLESRHPSTLAVGGQLKNTVCLTTGDQAFLSQHIGDLENADSAAFFEEAIAHLTSVLQITPSIVAHDLHPDYLSTRWALESGLPTVAVQHHHAHIASCMAENGINARVIGIALDGTGYGTDRNIWGGEILLVDYAGFERAAHLEYVPMPGGEAAVREPWRMAIGYMAQHFGAEFVRELPWAQQFGERRLEVLLRMVERSVQCPLTSSCGRLFDAVAALAGVRTKVTYEAQAAIDLELVAMDARDESAYAFELKNEGGQWIIGTRPLWEAVLADGKNRVSVSDVSRRFHNGLVDILAEAVSRIRESSGLERICLSGGTFNNTYLAKRLRERLIAHGLQVYTHHLVPCGDGGLSLGQAAVALHRAVVE